MARPVPLVAIIGRTNVGKSSLFNALAGRRLAVVRDEPGVTRDRHYAYVARHRFPFTLIDTGGIVGEDENELRSSVRAQAELAIEESDAIIALFDGVAGPQALDDEVVTILRRSGKPVVWVVNKTEHSMTRAASAEFYALGVDNVVPVSAAHKLGLDELLEALATALQVGEDTTFESRPSQDDIISLAVIGKPNVGKSTFLNKLFGKERVVTSPIAGTTRDNISIEFEHQQQRFRVIDTAGLRRKARVSDESSERYANLRTLRALASCDVAVVLLDATEGPPTEQDAKIAGLAHERGRSLIIAVNKWDAIEKDSTTAKAYTEAVQEAFKFAKYAPILFISALTGKRCTQVLEVAQRLHQAARVRVPTGELNRILSKAFGAQPPPVYRGSPIKLFFATQVEVAPPTFVLFVNFPKRLSFGYERYLKNSIRAEYPFEGVDIKLQLRKRTEKTQSKIDRRAQGA